MKINSDGTLCWYQFGNLKEHSDLIHAVTTKSKEKADCYFTMDIRRAPRVGLQNRRRICDILSIPADSLVVSEQVHGNRIAIVTSQDKGRGATSFESSLPGVDGLITAEADIPLMALSADCPLIGFFDPVRKVIALVHAGWRGTIAEIASLAVSTMQRNFQCEPADILAAISPSIGSCCYEVGLEVIKRVSPLPWGKDCLHFKNERCYFDLWQANIQQLLHSGLTENHIECARLCTKCHSDTFFSYRSDRKHNGLFGFILSRCET